MLNMHDNLSIKKKIVGQKVNTIKELEIKEDS
jgi:hypothetical protein